MKNKAYDLETYSFISGEKILLDANIWLYLFPPTGNPSYTQIIKKYAVAFRSLKLAQVKLVMDVLVLSEYINRYCRIEWQGGYKTTYPEFKKFRQSKDFHGVASSAVLFARKIVELCDFHSTAQNTLNIKHILDDFETGSIDFNDAVITDICRLQGFKLLTNDADFVTGGIELLTVNRKLIQACQ